MALNFFYFFVPDYWGLRLTDGEINKTHSGSFNLAFFFPSYLQRPPTEHGIYVVVVVEDHGTLILQGQHRNFEEHRRDANMRRAWMIKSTSGFSAQPRVLYIHSFAWWGCSDGILREYFRCNHLYRFLIYLFRYLFYFKMMVSVRYFGTLFLYFFLMLHDGFVSHFKN